MTIITRSGAPTWNPLAGVQVMSPRRADTWNPSRESSLRIWYAARLETAYADGDPMPILQDWSGNGFDATQTVAANQPLFKAGQINGRPAVQLMDASDQFIIEDCSLQSAFGTNAVTIFAVLNAGDILLGDAPGGGTHLSIWMNFGGFAYFRHRQFGVGGLDMDRGIPAGYDGVWKLLEFWRSGATGKIFWQEGVQIGADETDTADALINSTVDVQFMQRSAGTDYWLAELLVFNTALDDATEQKAYSYLNGLYALWV